MKLDREDVAGFLWLQRAIEHVLVEETKRRARSEERDAGGGKFENMQIEVHSYAPGVIEVSYDVVAPRLGRAPWSESTQYSEEYSLAEALTLCMGGREPEHEEINAGRGLPESEGDAP